MGKFILGYFVGYIASFITLAILQGGNKKTEDKEDEKQK